MILLIDTTKERLGKTSLDILEETSKCKSDLESANVLYKLGFKDIQEIPYECSNGEIITDGILCRYQVKGE